MYVLLLAFEIWSLILLSQASVKNISSSFMAVGFCPKNLAFA